MPPHHEYFWAAVALVAVLAVFAWLRLFPKRTNLSAAECARRDKGAAPPDESDKAEPKPPADEA
jgi:hypothetical protein